MTWIKAGLKIKGYIHCNLEGTLTLGSSSSEQDSIDWYPLGALPGWIHDGALACRGTEPVPQEKWNVELDNTVMVFTNRWSLRPSTTTNIEILILLMTERCHLIRTFLEPLSILACWWTTGHILQCSITIYITLIHVTVPWPEVEVLATVMSQYSNIIKLFSVSWHDRQLNAKFLSCDHGKKNPW